MQIVGQVCGGHVSSMTIEDSEVVVFFWVDYYELNGYSILIFDSGSLMGEVSVVDVRIYLVGYVIA